MQNGYSSQRHSEICWQNGIFSATTQPSSPTMGGALSTCLATEFSNNGWSAINTLRDQVLQQWAEHDQHAWGTTFSNNGQSAINTLGNHVLQQWAERHQHAWGPCSPTIGRVSSTCLGTKFSNQWDLMVPPTWTQRCTGDQVLQQMGPNGPSYLGTAMHWRPSSPTNGIRMNQQMNQ